MSDETPEIKFTPEFSEALKHFYTEIQKRYTRPQEFPATEPLTEEKKSALKKQLAEIMEPMDEDTRKGFGAMIYFVVPCLFEDTEPMKSFVKIDKYLRILLGDSYFSHLPNPMDATRIAIEAERIFTQNSLDNLFDALSKLPKGESWLDTIIPTLDVIFAQRYGWKEGIANKMTVTEMYIALENAIEHDDPQKPSIWDMTEGKSK